MSTRLQLAKDLKREAGIAGAVMTSTVSQTGEYERVVEWIDRAYEAIQNLNGGLWKFLQTEFSFNTIAATANYTKAAATLTELRTWKTDSFRCYLTATGISDQQDLEFVEWEDFRADYGRGSQTTLTGRPQVFTVKPNKSITFWPIPDAIYTIDGEYFKRAQVMDEDTDEPLIPEEFQSIIYWKGLMYYGAYTGADEKYSHGQNEYKLALNDLELDQLPEMEIGGPMA
jgi:hypothetical protein